MVGIHKGKAYGKKNSGSDADRNTYGGPRKNFRREFPVRSAIRSARRKQSAVHFGHGGQIRPEDDVRRFGSCKEVGRYKGVTANPELEELDKRKDEHQNLA
jgi:hypothetical protein